jgi:amino acid transporter
MFSGCLKYISKVTVAPFLAGSITTSLVILDILSLLLAIITVVRSSIVSKLIDVLIVFIIISLMMFFLFVGLYLLLLLKNKKVTKSLKKRNKDCNYLKFNI